jgi:nucleotidyltransferase substrate binding protein (TIGR01987 family)
MSDIEYSKFKDALKRLEERHQDYVELYASLPKHLQESVKESCIQRFEVCFEVCWKHLKKYLKEEQGLGDVPEGPKPLIKKAATLGVIKDAETWLEFLDKRNASSHDYSGDKADSAIKIVGYYIQEAITLYERMTGEAWK